MAPHGGSKGSPHPTGAPSLSGTGKAGTVGTNSGMPSPSTKPYVPSSSSSFRPSGTGQPAVNSPDNNNGMGATHGASWMSPGQHTRSVQPHPQSPVPPHVQTKHDQAAALMGLLAASGLTMDALMAMGEEKQKEALIAAATFNNSSRSETFGGQNNNSGSVSSVNSSNTNTLSSINDNNNEGSGNNNRNYNNNNNENNNNNNNNNNNSSNNNNNNNNSSNNNNNNNKNNNNNNNNNGSNSESGTSGTGSGGGGTGTGTGTGGGLPTPPESTAPIDPRKAMMEMIAKRAAKSATPPDAPPVPIIVTVPTAGAVSGANSTPGQCKYNY